MLFKPDTGGLWDTHIVAHNDKFYLYYLRGETGKVFDRYGLAISDDMLNWEDKGTIFTKDEISSGMGTGTVLRVGDRWIMSYSLWKVGAPQRICFVESTDLVNWTKMPDELDCIADPRWYEMTHGESSTDARWDCLVPVELEDGTYVGLTTASGKTGPAGANGVVGLATSEDGIHWKSQPPASEPCGMPWVEVLGYAKFDTRHYILIGGSSQLGPRFDSVYISSGRAGGMYVMMSDNAAGPYRLVDGDPMLLGNRTLPPTFAYIPAYCTRTFEYDGQIMANHHWMQRADLGGWLGTVKILQEAAPGKLVMKYWPGNDGLKGEKVFDLATASFPSTPFPQAKPTAEWSFENGVLTGESGATGLAYFDVEPGYEDGVVIEAKVKISGQGAAGLFFGTDKHGPDEPYTGKACLANRRGLYEFGEMQGGICSPAFMVEDHVVKTVADGKVCNWKILLRAEFIELYVDDELIQCYGFSPEPVRNLGLFVERCTAEISELAVYKFA